MKTLVKCLLLASLLISIVSPAQDPGDSKPLADKTSFKGKRELRKEERARNREKKHEKKQAREAHHKNNKAIKPNDVTKGTKRKRHKTAKNKEKKGLL